MTDDASKKAILARRAKFVAAALAGISIAACKDGGPMACLKVAAPHDAEAPTEPSVCLSPPMPVDSGATTDAESTPIVDAGTSVDSGSSADAATPKDAGKPIQPQPHPTPHVCLTPVRPRDPSK